MTAYYNEHDPYAAQWLRNLIAAEHIAPGDVDERDIRDIKPEELKKYTQCHFFAGIGVWSLALRQAGWSDDQPVWTGSCPCQPFSAAGRKAGFIDERHLWPHWFHLITQCEPGRIFGEQVASKDGLTWLDLVQTDLEGAGYANGAVDLCAAGVGTPGIRQRLWFVAERLGNTDSNRRSQKGESKPETGSDGSVRDSTLSGMGDTKYDGQHRSPQPRSVETTGDSGSQGSDVPCQFEGASRSGNGTNISRSGGENKRHGVRSESVLPGPTNGFWRDVDWLGCRDGKFRPVRPGTLPLVDGAPARVGRLRAYGNCINVEAAQAFIEAYLADQPVNSSTA